jgi:hypothetical protein
MSIESVSLKRRRKILLKKTIRKILIFGVMESFLVLLLTKRKAQFYGLLDRA